MVLPESLRIDARILQARRLPPASRFPALRRVLCMDRRRTHAMERRLAALPYREFLQTQYWRDVSAYVCRRGVCGRCGDDVGASLLEAHHTTYAHRGREWRHLGDLEPLCRLCHAQHHGQRPEPRPCDTRLRAALAPVLHDLLWKPDSEVA